MNRVFRGWGERIEVKVPDDLELFSGCHPSRPDAGGLDEYRALVKGCLVSPSLAELEKKSPACVRPVARMIGGLYGLSEPSLLLELGEDEIDEATAAIVVEREKAGQPGLYVIQFVPSPALKEPSLTFVLRPARSSRDLEEINRDAFSMIATREVMKRLCVHGPVDELASRYPGAFASISMLILAKAGVAEQLVVGEA